MLTLEISRYCLNKHDRVGVLPMVSSGNMLMSSVRIGQFQPITVTSIVFHTFIIRTHLGEYNII